ncbi:MAG: primosomal protein N' [Cyanobacteria bacterium P01_D01_bin.123]
MTAAGELAAWVEVIVDSPGVRGCYTYRIPPELHERLAPGDVLAVPFGSRPVGAIALSRLDALPLGLDAADVRDVEDIVTTNAIAPEFWQVLQHVAEYYVTPLAQVLRIVLPPGMLGRSQRRIQLVQEPTAGEATAATLSAEATSLLVLLQAQRGDASWLFLRRQVTNAAKGLRELQQQGRARSYWQETTTPKPQTRQAVTLIQDDIDGLTSRQAEVLVALRRLGGDAWMTELLSQVGATRQVVQALAQKQRVTIASREKLRAASQPQVIPDRPLGLTKAQQAAVDAIAAAASQAKPQVFLLRGVTGSGKTEVYLQAIASVLQERKSALVLVPEIGLTPQLTDRFRARFGNRVSVYHSGLSDGERYDTWRQLAAAEPRVVIGTRSAIFAPVQQLGLIVLDEEHDDSYKQDRPQPCYHARTVAQWRSRLSTCPLVLGSATPALETHAAAESGRVQRLDLPERIGAKSMPPVQVVDLRAELAQGNRSVLSQSLRAALEGLVDSDRQGILFLPRRGHSTFVSCRSCGEPLTCPQCDVSLTFHQVGNYLSCHYCGFRRSHPRHCPACESPYLKKFGTGTQRLVETLQADLPQLRVLRFDRDSTRNKGAHRQILDRFRAGEADVLVGTQMLTKGLDVPTVTLVGVVAADGLLNMADFRAGERAFQLLMQVAGRAGRGERAGQVIIQTYMPNHPAIASVCAYDYDGFVAREWQQRRETGFPPSCRLISLRVSSQQQDKAIAFCEKLVAHLENVNADMLGPCPAQVERVGGWFRWHILLKEPDGRRWRVKETYSALTALPSPPSQVRFGIDVDPLRLL